MIAGFRIDTSTQCIVEDESFLYDDSVRIDGLYYKTSMGILPVAYIFPESSREKVEALLAKLREAKSVYDKLVADTYYKEFPKLK